MGKRSRAKAGSLPSWYVGKLLRDDVDGTWEGERTGKIFKQRGINVTKKNFDSLTDEERAEQLRRTIR